MKKNRSRNVTITHNSGAGLMQLTLNFDYVIRAECSKNITGSSLLCQVWEEQGCRQDPSDEFKLLIRQVIQS